MEDKIKGFYRAFEDKHRGSRQVIKNRLTIYLPFVSLLKELYDKPKALDIGCGRGEWLELLSENGFAVKGVDLDAGMLEACQKINLDVSKFDGIKYLKSQEDESLDVISAFHVIEHIPFESLQILVYESLRVLKPGGLLILETPNAQNIKVATENFYMDPTHTKPIPSELLLFVSQYYGFNRTKILGLQQPKGLQDQNHISLGQVITSVSPDYALIAQKAIDSDISKKFDDVFTQDIGVSLDSLLGKFDNKIAGFKAKLAQVQADATKSQKQAAQAKTQALYAQEQAAQAKTQALYAQEQALQAQAQVLNALNLYELLVNSRSWKITKPLRFIATFFRSFLTDIKIK